MRRELKAWLRRAGATWSCSTAAPLDGVPPHVDPDRASTCRAASSPTGSATSRPTRTTLVVVNCAGRTRSILGAESLRRAGIPNQVVALRNGTMGWELAGLQCERGQRERFTPGAARAPPRLALARARGFAEASRRRRDRPARPRALRGGPDAHALCARRARPGRIRRRPPAGQPQRAGRAARAGDRRLDRRAQRPHRAARRRRRARPHGRRPGCGRWGTATCSWSRAGWTSCAAAPAAAPPALRSPDRRRRAGSSTRCRRRAGDRPRPQHRFPRRPYPGRGLGACARGWIALRDRLARRPARGPDLARRHAGPAGGGRGARPRPPRRSQVLAGGTAAWARRGQALLADRTDPPDEACVDFYLRPYDRNSGVEEAMRAYLVLGDRPACARSSATARCGSACLMPDLTAASAGAARAAALDLLLPPHCLTCDAAGRCAGPALRRLLPRRPPSSPSPCCARCGVPFAMPGRAGPIGAVPGLPRAPAALGRARARRCATTRRSRRILLPFKHGDRIEIAARAGAADGPRRGGAAARRPSCWCRCRCIAAGCSPAATTRRRCWPRRVARLSGRPAAAGRAAPHPRDPPLGANCPPRARGGGGGRLRASARPRRRASRAARAADRRRDDLRRHRRRVRRALLAAGRAAVDVLAAARVPIRAWRLTPACSAACVARAADPNICGRRRAADADDRNLHPALVPLLRPGAEAAAAQGRRLSGDRGAARHAASGRRRSRRSGGRTTRAADLHRRPHIGGSDDLWRSIAPASSTRCSPPDRSSMPGTLLPALPNSPSRPI